MKKFIYMLFSLSGLFLIGCNDNSGFMEGGKVENKSSLSRIEIIQTLSDSATPRTVPLGFETTFQAQAIYSNGEVKDVTETVKWSVDGVKYQSRMANGSFILKADSPGNVIITAEKTEEGKTKLASTGIDITDAVLAELQIKPAFLELPKGVFYDYRLVAIYSNGMQQIIAPQLIEWSVSDDSIAEFQSGRLYTRLAGEARIVAKYEGFEVSSGLEVKEAAPLTLMINNSHINLIPGSEYQLKANVSYDNGSVVDVTNQVQWTSDSPSIFDFDRVDKGKGTARSTGDTILKAQFTDPITNKKLDSNTVSMIVTNEIVALVVHPIKNMVINTFQSISADLVFENGGKQDVTNSVVWDIGDSTVLEKVSVDRLQAKSRGNTEISARFCDAQNKCFSSRTFNVTVEDVSLTGIEMAPARASVNINTDFIFSAVGRFSDNTLRDITAEVAFNSANNLIGEFTENRLFARQPTGLSTPLRVDVCHVESGLCDSGGVEILDKKVSHIMITPARLDATKNVSMNINALAVYNDGSSEDITSRATWTHTHADASIQDQGTGKIFHARDVGNAIITARFSNVSASVPVTVNDNTIAKITVTPGSVELYVGIDNDVSAIAVFNDNSVKDISSQVSWRPSDNQIYQPDPTINKIRTDALISGPATLKAVYQGIESSPVDVTVTESLPKQLIISPNDIELRVGTSIQLLAHIVFYDGNVKNVTKDVTWSLMSTDIQINNTGVISGNSATQNAQVSASHPTYPNLSSNIIGVKVVESKPIKVVLGTGDVELYTEDEYSLRVFAVYEDGSDIDITAESQITLGNASLATVSSAKKLIVNTTSGETDIRVSWQKFSTSNKLKVKSRNIIDVVTYPERILLQQSEVVPIDILWLLEGGKLVQANNFTLTSDNPTILGLESSTRKLIGLSAGTTTLTITSQDASISKSIDVVVSPHLDTLSLNLDKIEILQGSSAQLRSFYTDKGIKYDVTRGAVWDIDDPNLGVVSFGKITAKDGMAGYQFKVNASVFGRRSNEATIKIIDSTSLPSCDVSNDTQMCRAIQVGGYGGTLQNVKMCDSQEILTGFRFYYNPSDHTYPGVGIAGMCSTLYINASNEVKLSEGRPLVADIGTNTYSNTGDITCKNNTVLVGMEVKEAVGNPRGNIVGAFKLHCQALTYNPVESDINLFGNKIKDPSFSPIISAPNFVETATQLGTQQVIVGYQARTGSALDGITILSSPLDMAVAP